MLPPQRVRRKRLRERRLRGLLVKHGHGGRRRHDLWLRLLRHLGRRLRLHRLRRRRREVLSAAPSAIDGGDAERGGHRDGGHGRRRGERLEPAVVGDAVAAGGRERAGQDGAEDDAGGVALEAAEGEDPALEDGPVDLRLRRLQEGELHEGALRVVPASHLHCHARPVAREGLEQMKVCECIINILRGNKLSAKVRNALQPHVRINKGYTIQSFCTFTGVTLWS